MTSDSIVLTDTQQEELSRITQSRSLPAGYVFRARLILMLAEGASFSMIQRSLRTTAPTIIRWKQRFLAERHGFEYYRHGTLSLYAALETSTGRVHGKTAARHTSQDFVAFLKEVVSLCPAGQQIHIILDNLSAHKTALVREFLEQNPYVRFHFTPTYSSWLNQVELWFAKIEREVIARGVFTSVAHLARKLRRYINAYSANSRPIQWKYSDHFAAFLLTNSLRQVTRACSH